MKLIYKYLKPFWKVISIILLAHVVQAYSTLLLPTYTSGLVDTGIQNKGFEYAVPLAMTDQTWSTLESMGPGKLESQLDEYYDQDSQGGYRLKKDYHNSKDLALLEEDWAKPMAVYQELTSQDKSDANSLGQAQEQVNQLEKVSGSDFVLNLGRQAALTMYQEAGLDSSQVQLTYLWSKGLQMLGITLVTISSAVLAFYLASRVGADLGYGMREALFKRVLSFSDHEIEEFTSASLITRTTNDVQQVQFVLTIFLRIMMYSPILAVGGMVYLLGIQPNIIWILGVSIGIIAVMVVILFKLTLPQYRKVQALFDRVNLIAREILTGIQVIRAFGRQDHERQRFDRANRDLQATHLFSGRVLSTMLPFMIFVLDASSVLIVWNGSHQIASGSMQVGDMMAFIAYSMQILIAFVMLSNMSLMFPRALVALGRIDDVLEQEIVIQDPDQAKTVHRLSGEVRFDHVNFAYDDADELTLEDISFVAKPGQTTAFIGSTGSGKSTILNLLMRFYDVSQGSISLDGINIKEMTQADLHRQIGYVPQKGLLFSGTIASNIAFGVDDLDNKKLAEAADIAHASEFIQEKDKGYQARIAQGGNNVSGGQKQRLSIARAIAKDPSIYLFDDSFSALDYRTDASLRKALKDKVAHATVIIVAQRISTILDADQIIVLDDGRIDGIGRHQELMTSSSVYREIAESQLSQAELDRQAKKGGEIHGSDKY